jgi:hypothetical protein
MTPTAVYRKLNEVLWSNRLPKATVVFVEDGTMPSCFGLTIHDDICVKPVIFLNRCSTHSWKKTLVHECLHVAEPTLRHGKIFDALVDLYWRKTKKEIL